MIKTLHLMTQRNQSYGSRRRCCEECGLMLVARPHEFWDFHSWTDDPADFECKVVPPHDVLTPCNQIPKHEQLF